VGFDKATHQLPAPNIRPEARPVHDPTKAGLFAFDIDGTVTAYGDLVPQRTRQALASLRQAGVAVIPATGRSVTGLLAIVEQLGLPDGWAVVSNGSLIGRLDSASPHGFVAEQLAHFNPAPLAQRVRQLYPSALFACEQADGGWWATGQFPEGELHPPLAVRSFSEVVGSPVNRLVVRGLDIEPGALDEIMRQAVGVMAVTYQVGWTAWADVTPHGVTKASGLEIVRQRLGIAAQHTVAIGDGSNDESMLRWASRAAAVGSASPSVRQAATENAPELAEQPVAWLAESVLSGLTGQ
jgi:hydroxymethylpyrimidine pyrophosphatase-like HAD family hydrolase